MRCNELTQTRYLLRTEVDTISVSSTMTTCSCYQTLANTSDSPTRIPLVIGYHPAIRSISSISSQTHLHSLILSTLCHSAEIYLSLNSYVLTSRKFATWTSRSKPELSIIKCYLVIHCSKSPICPQDHRREQAPQEAILTGSNLNYLKGGGRFGNPEVRSRGKFESNYKMAASEGERSIRTILRGKKGGTVNRLSML